MGATMNTTRRGFITTLAVLLAGPAPRGRKSETVELISRGICIAGYCYYGGAGVENTLSPGQRLRLLRQPANEHDQRAIEIFSRSGIKLGYVPRDENAVASWLMDRGERVTAFVREVCPERPTWQRVVIDVCLMRD